MFAGYCCPPELKDGERRRRGHAHRACLSGCCVLSMSHVACSLHSEKAGLGHLSSSFLKNLCKNNFFLFYFSLFILCFIFWPCHMACGSLVPWLGIEHMPPALAAQSLNHWKRKCQSLSRVWLFAIPWTVALQTSLSMEFSSPEY